MAVEHLKLDDKEMLVWLESVGPKQLEVAVGRSLFRQAHTIMTESKRGFVPVAPILGGTLRASGAVEKPRLEEGVLTVRFGYGGAASAYAAVQHNTKEYRHTVGTWQYLARPTMRYAMRLKKEFTKDLREILERK